VVVNDPAKAGKDAAEPCRLNQATGIKATTDFQTLLT